VVENGQRRTINVCREHYAELRAQQASPFESLFSGFGGLGDDLLGGMFDEAGRDGGGRSRAGREPAPGESPLEGSSVLTDYMSDQRRRSSSRRAHRRRVGAREVDSEHLLYALATTTSCSHPHRSSCAEELKQQVQEISPSGREEKACPGGGIASRPGQGGAARRLQRSRDLATATGPEHLLIDCPRRRTRSQLLRRYGLTPEAIRQQTVRVVGKARGRPRRSEERNAQLDKYSATHALAKQGKLDR